MPAEFLRDISRPPRTVKGPRVSMLPISIAAHAMAALAVLIVPLVADGDPPTPARLPGPSFLTARALPSPPPPPSGSAPRTAAGPSAIPTEPPSTIPENDSPSAGDPTPGGLPDSGTITPGFPGGLGTTLDPAPPALPPPPPQQVLVRAGHQGVQVPRKIVNVPPVYPIIARNSHIEGHVILEAVINERGAVERIKVLKSVMLLDAAAIDAVKQWRYTPTLLNGIPVSVLMTITVQFSLHE